MNKFIDRSILRIYPTVHSTLKSTLGTSGTVSAIQVHGLSECAKPVILWSPVHGYFARILMQNCVPCHYTAYPCYDTMHSALF